jgi:hypothetical protein
MRKLIDMPTYIRAVVSDEEKENCKKRAGDLDMTVSELLRKGLKKMGVKIEVEKAVGVPSGTINNAEGKGGRGKVTPELEAEVRADYGKLTWEELSEKYDLSYRTISKIVK